MFYNIIELGASFLEIFFLLYTCNLFFERKMNKKIHGFVLVLFSVLITLITTYLNSFVVYSYVTLTIWIITATTCGTILYKCNPIKICSTSLLYMILISAFDSLFLVFVEYVLRAPDFVYAVLTGRGIERVVTLIISKSILASAYWLIRKKQWKVTITLTASVILIIFGILSFASMQYLITMFFSNKEENTQTIILVAFAFMTLFFLSILLILNSNEKIKHETTEKELIESKLKISEERNKKIIETYREIAKISHDHNNQLKVISQLLADGMIKEARKYLSQIVTNPIHKSTPYTGFHSIDAVLTEKNRLSKEKNILIDFNISITSIYGILEIDICTILLNLIDNSIEACLKNTDPNNKKINVTIKNINSMLFIKIENPVISHERTKDKSSLFTTSKPNRDKHGYGLIIVNSLAEKYNGTLITKNENNVFTSTLLLSN